MAEQSDVAGRRRRLVSQTEQSNSSSLIPQIGHDLSINCLARCSRSDYGSIASVNRSFRSLIRSGELYWLRRQMGIVEHCVYFSCNPCQWLCFDPVGIQWMHLPRLTLNCFTLSDIDLLAVGTELLVFGREFTSHEIYKYSILTKSWSLGSEMNEPRCLFGSASLGEIAIVAGGSDPEGNILSSAEIYNLDTGTWASLPRMNRPRTKCSGVFMDGNFYVVGGNEVGILGQNVLTCGEMYDLETRTWHVIPNMFPARHRVYEAPPLLAVVKNELYAAFDKENEVRKYDKGRNLWSTVGNLPERAVRIGGWGMALRAYGDQLILIVSELSRGGIEVYDCVLDEGPLQWSLLTFNDEPSLGALVTNCTVMSC
ncbi:hypothetical protein Vadar_013731 [Vaccinium darrowii]|uniref:Uncharacterized protein n=1 Tax=Vaccinium darrowii TaxID=229202 RepID=A0ACB7X0D7_9ERIC|nr:hypothetical protein Vadar_013731 [Vaccinium darrowii]